MWRRFPHDLNDFNEEGRGVTGVLIRRTEMGTFRSDMVRSFR